MNDFQSTDKSNGKPSLPKGGRLSAVWKAAARRLQVPDDKTWLILSLVSAAILISGITVAALADPRTTSLFPRCPVKMLTGLDCPGCGTGRAIHAAAHGHFREAFLYNPFLCFVLPLVAALVIRPQWAKKPAVAWGTFAVSILWMILRNIV